MSAKTKWKRIGDEIVVNVSRNNLKWFFFLRLKQVKKKINKPNSSIKSEKSGISKTIIREENRLVEAFYLNLVCVCAFV